MTTTFRDADGTARLSGEILMGGTAGQVATVQADGTLAPAAATGGSGPVVRGPYAFAFNTPNIQNGILFYVPTVNDILLDAWIEVDTAFDGTTPQADIGPFDGDTVGYFGNAFQAIDLSVADNVWTGSHLRSSTQGGAQSNYPLSLGGIFFNLTTIVRRSAPAKFLTADPLLLVVSQDGEKGGAAVGGAAGAGLVYIVTATPTAFA